MRLISIYFSTLILIGLGHSNLLAYKVIIDIYQKCNETIHFLAWDETGYIDRDLQPYIKKRYIMEDESNNLDKIEFNIKGQTKTQIIELDQVLDYGHTPYMKVGNHFKFLSNSVVYEFRQTYTWENQLHLDDTLYFTITFLDLEDFRKLLAEENLPKDYLNIAMETAETFQSYLSTFWAVIRNDL